MASLQANHTRSCALGRVWTPFQRATDGCCTCPEGPFYYVVVHVGGHTHREAVGRDRDGAEVALRRLETAVEDGSYRPRPSVGFMELADRWLASVERKPSTVGSYRSTMLTPRRSSDASESAAFPQRTSSASIGPCVTVAARLPHVRSTYVCSAHVFKQPSSIGTRRRIRSASFRRRRGLARSARRLPTSRTTNCRDSSPTFEASHSGRCA
jgi:hypothetical protein